MRKRFWKGLRTIDLIIGLSIICMVLVVIARNYDEFKCRAMQSEAKFSLQEIFLAQKLYFAEHERYATIEQLVKIDGRAAIPQKFYTLSDLFRPTENSFVVLAKGAHGTMVAGEEWSIDQTNELLLRKGVCKN
jgi:Tfp pilus assembly protein PilE